MFLFTGMTTFNHNNVFAEALTRTKKNKNFDIDQKNNRQKHRNTEGKRKKIKNTTCSYLNLFLKKLSCSLDTEVLTE